jgi:deoxyadenosine/deoxycytidine kinase
MRNEGNMDASEFNIYNSLCDTLMLNCPLEAIIYLKCDPAICHERIKKRNRQGEEGIPLGYLRKVHDRHEEWISRQQNVKILTIDTGVYDVENPEELGQLLATIKEFILSLN